MTDRRFLLLDRDGVINAYRPGIYVSRPEDLAILPGVLETLANLTRRGIEVIVISNQAGIGKGLLPPENLAAITDRMLAEITAAGGRILDVLYCPHRPEDVCDCRKPRPGMILTAARRHQIHLPTTCFVGDSRSDIEAAAAAGCRSALVLTGQAALKGDWADWPIRPDLIAPDLAAAIEMIFGELPAP
jgi:D-glycero-D-manno-heptose 1,7-bisphosphate phosphatase